MFTYTAVVGDIDFGLGGIEVHVFDIYGVIEGGNSF